MSICCYYNTGPKTLLAYKHKLHTDPDEGTYYKNIRDYAQKLGLNAEVKTDMSIRANASQFLRIICLSDNLMQKIHVESRVQAFAGDALLGGMSLE